MEDRIQKTIISKFIYLNNKDEAHENEIVKLMEEIEFVYHSKYLNSNDFYYQKIRIIYNYLNSAFDKVKNKRVNKSVNLDVNKEFISILENDIDGVDYNKANIEDLKNYSVFNKIEINKENVAFFLENLIIPMIIDDSRKLEDFLVKEFEYGFDKDNVHQQYNIGGLLSLKTDIDIGNGQVGIEVKLYNVPNASEMERAIGQIVYYKNRFYKVNLILYILSHSDKTPKIKELIELIEELGVQVIFKKSLKISLNKFK